MSIRLLSNYNTNKKHTTLNAHSIKAHFSIKNVRSTGSAVCTFPIIPYCQATTVTLSGYLLRGGILVNINLFLLPAAGPVGHGGYDIGASFISKGTGVQADVVVLHPAPFLFSKHFIIFFSLLVFAPDMGFDVL